MTLKTLRQVEERQERIERTNAMLVAWIRKLEALLKANNVPFVKLDV